MRIWELRWLELMRDGRDVDLPGGACWINGLGNKIHIWVAGIPGAKILQSETGHD
jgi:hypothetical protein